MDRFFDQMLDRGWMRPMGWERPLMSRLASMEPRIPKVDVIDNEKDILVRAELPGVDRKDVDVSVNDNSVTIRAETRSESKTEEDNYYRCEISRGSFSRTVGLPGEVDADKADAKMNDGILELRLPKLKSARRRKIDVK
ncbi:Hsp20/alpha crystallin family protein [Ectothiorhodospiraceae bacterium WFHF3C12]|nr:Hsp20/alpha crystallin family protein [Ectothiorhodospiraceae bacterium WFHF3C12]